MATDSPFKQHKPILTSSPIDGKAVFREPDYEGDRTVSPVLFLIDEAVPNGPLPEAPLKEVPELGDDPKEASPELKFCLTKVRTAGKEETPRKAADGAPEKTPARCSTPTLETKGKTPVQRQGDAPVSVVTLEPQCPHPPEKSIRARTELSSFLQKLKESVQSRPEPPRNAPSLVKLVAPPLDLEDDFLIMEDEAPPRFTFGRRSNTSQGKKSLKSQSKSSDEEGQTDKGSKDGRLQKEENQPELAETGTGITGEAPTVRQESRKEKAAQGGGLRGPASRTPKNKAKTLASGPGTRDEVGLEAHSLPHKKRLPADKQPSKKQTGSGATFDETSEAVREPQKTTAAPREANGTDTGRSGKKSPEAVGSVAAKRERKKENPGKQQRKPRKESKRKVRALSTSEEPLPSEAVEDPGAEPSGKEHRDTASPVEGVLQDASPAEEIPKPKGRRKAASGSQAGGRGAQATAPVGPGEARQEKRKRSKPGDWWRSCPTEADSSKEDVERSGGSEPEATAAKRATQATDATQGEQRRTAARKAKRAGERAKDGQTPAQADTGGLDGAEERAPDEPLLDVEDPGAVQLSPASPPRREHSFKSAEKVFDRIYGQSVKEKPPSVAVDVFSTPAAEKRVRKVPSNWWEVNKDPQEAKDISPLPREPSPTSSPRASQQKRLQAKPQRHTSSSSSKKGNAVVTLEPGVRCSRNVLKRKLLSAPKSVKRSLATFRDIYSSGVATPVSSSGNRVVRSNLFREEQAAESSGAGDFLSGDPSQKFNTDTGNSPEDNSHLVVEQPRGQRRSKETLASCSPKELQEGTRPSNNMSQDFRSGLTTMIDLQHYEESGDQNLPSSVACGSVLSVDELCGPPLVPLELQAGDKTRVAGWLRSIWPGIVNNGGQVTVEQFSWYKYRSRALGLLMDIQSDAFCNGKILLGSFARKPLWVDHSATSVFHVLTSGVSVTINGNETVHNPAQSFFAPCGNAYSIRNLTNEPALLCFTRMLAESPDCEDN